MWSSVFGLGSKFANLPQEGSYYSRILLEPVSFIYIWGPGHTLASEEPGWGPVHAARFVLVTESRLPASSNVIGSSASRF